MAGRITYGHISELTFYMNSHFCTGLNKRDQMKINQAANNHIEMVKITMRMLS